MEITKSLRGEFYRIDHEAYGVEPKMQFCLVREASDGEYLWFGQYQRLNKEDVKDLVKILTDWIDHGSLNGVKNER